MAVVIVIEWRIDGGILHRVNADYVADSARSTAVLNKVPEGKTAARRCCEPAYSDRIFGPNLGILAHLVRRRDVEQQGRKIAHVLGTRSNICARPIGREPDLQPVAPEVALDGS